MRLASSERLSVRHEPRFISRIQGPESHHPVAGQTELRRGQWPGSRRRRPGRQVSALASPFSQLR